MQRDRAPVDEYAWHVLRRVHADEEHELFVRATTHARALALVCALIAFDRSFARDA